MNKVFVLALMTLKEIIKSKIIFNVFLFGIGLMIVTAVASEFTYGVPARVAIDFGLGTLTLVVNAIAIFLGVGLITKEIDSRTIYMILSRPVSRAQFLFGKVLGLISVQMIICLILGSLSLASYFIWDGQFNIVIIWAFFFIFIESVILLLLVITFSLVTNPVLTVSNSIVLLICGHIVNEVKTTNLFRSNPLIRGAIEFYTWFFPNFYKFNLKDFVIYEQSIPFEFLSNSLLYAFFYALVLVVLSIIIFNKKNLD